MVGKVVDVVVLLVDWKLETLAVAAVVTVARLAVGVVVLLAVVTAVHLAADAVDLVVDAVAVTSEAEVVLQWVVLPWAAVLR